MRIPLLAAAVSLSACGGTSVVGTITDVAGSPLSDTMITGVGTLCQTTTEDDGSFKLRCNHDGEVVLAITATGYVSKEIDLDLTEPKQYDLGNQVLIKIPDGTGLFLFDGASYSKMEPGWLERRVKPTTGDPRRKSFCLDDTSPKNVVPAGNVPMYDKRADDWRMFKLDADRCARHLKREGLTWTIEYSEKPEMTSRDVEAEQSVHIAQVETGEYFIAWWKAGTFVEDREARTDEGERRYGGYWVVVE